MAASNQEAVSSAVSNQEMASLVVANQEAVSSAVSNQEAVSSTADVMESNANFLVVEEHIETQPLKQQAWNRWNNK